MSSVRRYEHFGHLDDFHPCVYANRVMSELTSSRDEFDLAALQADVAMARRILDFGAGTFEHSISLPSEQQIHADHRHHRNNLPFADALRRCRYLGELFDGFETEKASFRLLRRAAGTAYSFHDDRDIGHGIIRMQLPVVTNKSSVLLVEKDAADMRRVARRVNEVSGDGDPIIFDYRRFCETFGDWFDAFLLEPGHFYLVDTDRVHTLINAGDAERITLSIDLVRNRWLDRWMAEHMTRKTAPLSDRELPVGKWEWSALRHGVLCHPRVEPA